MEWEWVWLEVPKLLLAAGTATMVMGQVTILQGGSGRKVLLLTMIGALLMMLAISQ